MDILILGHNGMLGHMLVKYFTEKGHTIHTTNYRFPTEEFKEVVKGFNGDFIINAIGAIPQKTSTFSVNTDLPIWLTNNTKCKVIHPGTDCEVDHDDYGTSKREASNHIKDNSTNTKILKASIIGPEIRDRKSLLEWFLNNTDEVVKGWGLALWSGITTLEWSKHCEQLMNSWEDYPVENIVESTCLPKYELLKLFGKVFNIEKQYEYNNTVIFDKCLKGNLKASHIETQLQELKEYYYDRK